MNEEFEFWMSGLNSLSEYTISISTGIDRLEAHSYFLSADVCILVNEIYFDRGSVALKSCDFVDTHTVDNTPYANQLSVQILCLFSP